MRNEEWRPVPGYEGWYEVSNYARVRSVDRDIRYNTGHVYHRRGKVLAPNDRGMVMLGCNGSRVHRNVFDLAQAAFSTGDNWQQVTPEARLVKQLGALSGNERVKIAAILRSCANLLDASA